MRSIFHSLAHLIAPRVCRVCGQTLIDSESLMCLHCNLDLPRTGLHKSDFNIIHQRLGHHAKVDQAAGWFYYKKSSAYAQMLVDAKYSSLPHIDRQLGEMCAEELARDGFFHAIDVLVPMPIHWTKRLSRGYNQALEICKGISSVTGLPIVEALRAARAHGIQARHSREQRYSSIQGTLAATKVDISGQRVLLVDDIITTGATAAEGLRVLHTMSPASVSLLTLGVTIQGS